MASRTRPLVCHDLIVTYFHADAITSLEGRTARPRTTRPIRRVTSLPLVIAPGAWVRCGDRYFHLKDEGLYRFMDWGKVRYDNRDDRPTLIDNTPQYASVIVYKNDLVALLGALCIGHVHGRGHQGKPLKDQIAALKHGHLSLTCGPVSDFLAAFLPSLGVQVRRAAVTRTQGRYNTYDNGHQMVEVFFPDPGKWALFDITIRNLFKRNGKLLSAGELSELCRAGLDFDAVRIAPEILPMADTSESVGSSFNPSIMHVGNQERWRAWFTMMMHCVSLLDKSVPMWYFYHDDETITQRVLRNVKYTEAMDRTAWFRKFYNTAVPRFGAAKKRKRSS